MPSTKDARPPLIVLLGPTAVGKTETALELAERVDGEIVSADSRLFYHGMDLGTAKPTPAERDRVPHHLIDVAPPDEIWSLARFLRAARAAIDEIHARGTVPFLVGGTGQYIRAVVEGWRIPRQRPDPQLRVALERWAEIVGPEGLHARLAHLDPAAAARIDPRNLRRTVRALEVIFGTGRRFSKQRRKKPPPYRTLQLGLIRPREELYARIDARLDSMMSAGFLDEVAGLLAAGYDPDLPSLSAIGYGELVDHLQGEISLEEALRRIRRKTRQFVRRQANWFPQDDPEMVWFEAGPGVVDAMETAVRRFLRAGQ